MVCGAASGPSREDVGGGERAAVPAAGSLWDEEGTLSGTTAGTRLRVRLRDAARRAGVPIAILVVGRRAATREPLDEMARRTFAERRLAAGTGTPDAVLLVAAPALRRSVIETGKGDAGIVPEIDARDITAELQRRFSRSSTATAVAQALSDAADGIATSILATGERRRPLAEDERADGAAVPGASRRLAVDPGVAATPGEGRVPGGGPLNQSADPSTNAPAGGLPGAPGPRRPMLPVAAGLAIMLVLALGLRQRRRGHDDGQGKNEPPRR